MEQKTKYILIGLSVVAVSVGGYFAYDYFKKRNVNKNNDFGQDIYSGSSSISNQTTPSLPSPSQNYESGSSNVGFPLRKGSNGSLVTNLQKALIKKYGSSILPKYGADGGFGSETQSALQSKGLPTVIDSDAYTKILLSAGSSSSNSSSSTNSSKTQIANKIHDSIVKDNFWTAIAYLKKIKNVSDYTAVSNEFKKKRIGLVRMTLVTGLLSSYSSTSEKKKINEQLYRIGLKYDGSKWSLSGLSGINSDKLITIVATKIWDDDGSAMMIPKGTIVGEYLDANNGVTEIETMDGKRLFIRTNAISYKS